MGNESSSSNQSTATQSRGTLSSRRSFLAGAGAAALGVGMFANVPLALAQTPLTTGDEAILRFLAAAEILETDRGPYAPSASVGSLRTLNIDQPSTTTAIPLMMKPRPTSTASVA